MLPSKRVNPQLSKDFFEKESWAKGLLVCGIDEVGRGCLAGPVVAAAVILPLGKKSPLLKDSKILTKQEREKAFLWIQKHCSIGVGVLGNRIIDQQNIRNATLSAMKKAFLHLMVGSPSRPEIILIDAMPLSLANTAYSDIPVSHFIQGESRSSSIAAASIVAKVTRDLLMEKMDHVFPGYALAKHKGYSTSEHKAAFKKNGPSIIHRTLFIRNIMYEWAHEKQLTLC